MPSNYIYSIYEDRQQQLWIAAGNTAVMLRDGIVYSIPPLPGISRTTAFLQQTDSTIWMGTSRGLFELPTDGSAAKPVSIHPGLDTAFITHLLPADDVLWIGTTTGLYLLGDQLQAVSLPGAPFPNIQHITTDTSGIIWVATFGNGIFHQDPSAKQGFIKLPGERLEQATDLFVGRDQRIWICTQNAGIRIFSPADSSWTSLTEREGLPNNNVRMVREDHWGNCWIATSGGGIARYLGQFFLHYDRQNGLPDERVYALARDTSGRIWASVGNTGLVYLDSTGFRPFKGDSAYLSMKAKAMLFDRQNRLWVGTEGGGLLVFDTSGYRVLGLNDGLPSDWIRDIVEDRSGAIWVATYGSGLARITEPDTLGFQIRRYGRESGMRDLRIMDLAIDKQDNIWYCTRYGEAGRFQYGSVRQLFDASNGLPDAQIRSIAFDSLDNIWLGTAGAGLFRKSMDADSLIFRPFAGENALHSANPYLLIFDQQGQLWVGTERGVEKIFFTEAGIFREAQSFGRNEGFLGIETTLNTALCDPSGELWFGTLNGLTRHIPTERIERTTRPILHFREISLFYQPLRETEFADWALPGGGIRPGLELPYRKDHLRFSFSAVDLQDPAAVRYHWRLEGAEEEWSPLTDQQSVNYTNLPPGTYTFRVEATTDGNHFSTPLSASFTIKPPYWQLWWVQLLGAAGLVGLIVLFTGLRIRRIRLTESRKREELELKNRLLQLESKALQLQMNPHFIFNALNSIQGLVATGDASTARREISHFAGLMRSILSNSRQQAISLEEEVATLEKYLRMEQFCQSTPFEYHIELPNDPDPAETEIPPMLLQPFVENAIIHGISHLNHTGLLEIRFTIEEDLLCCEITDNGVGRERAEALRKSRAPGHQSVAMQVTRERLNALLAGKKDDPLSIEDITDARGAVTGTRVRIWLPLQRNF